VIREVARREITTRGRSKAYRFTTLGLIALMVIAIVAAAVSRSDGDDVTTTIDVGVVGPPDAVSLDSDGLGGIDFVVTPLAADDLDQAVSAGDVDVAVDLTTDQATLVWDSAADPSVEALLLAALVGDQLDQRAAELGIDDDALDTLLAPPDVGQRFLDPESDSDSARTGVAIFGVLLLFFTIQVYGAQIALVVIEEKANRIVEILLALVRPRTLLTGKVIGVGVLAALQVLIVLAGLVGALAVSGFSDVPVSAYLSLPLMFVTFVLGFGLYGVLFAMVGSLVSRQEDAQQALLPVYLPIFAGYIIALQAAASPDSLLATIGAIVPFTSPFVLPVLVATGSVSVIFVIVSILLLVASTIGLLLLAGRVYEFTLLRSGSRIKLLDALRLNVD